jgi:predicted MPP superfamily phosphohydrolase
MALWIWLGSLLVSYGITLSGVYRGGRTRNDHLMAFVVSCCFGVYGLLGVGALRAWQAWSPALVGLGLGAALLASPFVLLARRRDPGRGLGWWLMLASQPAYAFAFWGGAVLGLWLFSTLITGAAHFWPGHWLWLALVLALWGSFWGLAFGQRVRRHRLSLPTARGPGLRLVQLSDIHFGPGFPLWQLQALCDRVGALAPDLVLITGDLVGPFSDSPGEHDGLVETLAALPAPVLFCPGNHDMPRWRTLGPELRAGGISVLQDETVSLEVAGERVWVLGVGFPWGRSRVPVAEVIRGAVPPPDASVRLVLSHGPSVLDLLGDQTADLGLAGHTHGGPVALGMLGLPVSILRLTASHDHGLHRRRGVWHYVHAGNWLIGMPPRIGTAPEIVVVEIAPPASS